MLSDTSLDPKRWGAHKVVVLTTLDYLDATLQQSLVDYAAAGGVVVMGPRAPRFDSLMRPCTILADAIAAGASGIVLVATKDEAAQAVHRACVDAAVPAVLKNDPDLDVIVHADNTDPARRVVFVVNPTSRTVDASVSLGHSLSSVQELWAGTEGHTDNETIRASLAPYSIHIYDCRLS